MAHHLGFVMLKLRTGQVKQLHAPEFRIRGKFGGHLIEYKREMHRINRSFSRLPFKKHPAMKGAYTL